MPSKYDLIQMINRDNHYARETIEDINELIEDIDTDPKKFTYELAQEIENFSQKLNLCPLCGSELIEIDKWDESRGEHCGREVSEIMYKYGCESSNCSYVVD